MIDELTLNRKRIAYLDRLRALYRRERWIGFGTILAGAALLVISRYVPGFPEGLVWSGYGLLAAGWLLFVYVIWRRTAWRRANPFNPDA
ncbi:MAG: hypothetical protein EBS42_03925 [Caulobacteraceae bacterium]|jgi:hypothetical protein|nr:hypothetical protein [Caulobacteraceae bacterium]